MITLVTEPRQSIFGTLHEWGVDRSEEGKAVYDAWQGISSRFPFVRATYNAIMPDHFHGIIYVTEEGKANLNEVVQHFTETVERSIGRKIWASVYRDSICIAQGQLHRQIEYILANAKRRWVKENNRDLFHKVLGFRHWRLRRADAVCTVARKDDGDWSLWSFAREVGDECWSVEDGEEIAKPRKANKRVSPFSAEKTTASVQQQGGATSACCRTLAVPPASLQTTASVQQQGGTVDWVAVGNPFLLDAPLLISTSIPAETPDDELAKLSNKIVAKAERGAVVLSLFITPGEKAVKNAVLEAGGSVVQLLTEGMGRYYKPRGRDFTLCAEGRLLQLTPFKPREDGIATREQDCKSRIELLNAAARRIADASAEWKREEQQAYDSKVVPAERRQQAYDSKVVPAERRQQAYDSKVVPKERRQQAYDSKVGGLAQGDFSTLSCL